MIREPMLPTHMRQTHLEACPTQHKLNNALLLAPLKKGQVLFGLVGAGAGQGDIIVVVHRRVLALVVHALLAALPAGLRIHQRLILCAALVVSAMPNNLGKTPYKQ